MPQKMKFKASYLSTQPDPLICDDDLISAHVRLLIYLMTHDRFLSKSYPKWPRTHLLLSLNYFTAAVVLVPARELALQTAQVCKELGKHLNVQVVVVTGGTVLRDDILRLQQTGLRFFFPNPSPTDHCCSSRRGRYARTSFGSCR